MVNGDFEAETLVEIALAIQYVMGRLDVFPETERRVILSAAGAFLARYDVPDVRAA